ncbi:MAG: hypothetical protein HYR94_05150 [Chloroflexi bacterium]|nr:hypothetical protein [Chloroflexota bacterium]
MYISPLAGLCAACRHVKVIQSAKGSFFIMCGRAKTDPRFSKYPILPVLQCSGYEQQSEENEKPK